MRRHNDTAITLLATLVAGALGWFLGRRTRPGGEVAEQLWATAEAVRDDVASPAATPDDDEDDTRRTVRAKADQVAASRRSGSPEDRAAQPRASVGLDVQRLQSMKNALEPVVQYLTYIQSRRGDDSALLFIRYDDIDAMAELDGEPSQELMERLDQLGVVVSAN